MAIATHMYGVHDYSSGPGASVTWTSGSMYECIDENASTLDTGDSVSTDGLDDHEEKSWLWVIASTYTSVPKSCGFYNWQFNLNAYETPKDTGKDTHLGYYVWFVGAASVIFSNTAYSALTETAAWYYKTSSVNKSHEQVAGMKFGVKSGSTFGKDKYGWLVNAFNASLNISYDTLAPSTPSLLTVMGRGMHETGVNIYPTLGFRYQDSTNATGGNYDSTSWVQWIVGTQVDGSTVNGTVWSSGSIATTGVTTSQYCIIQYGSINSLHNNTTYYAKTRCADLAGNMSGWSAPGSFKTTVVSADWWNSNWHRRAQISFGTSHSTMLEGYTAEFDFSTGVIKTIATTGHWNESIQPGAISKRRGDKSWVTWRNSGASSGALAAVYHHDTNTIGTIVGPIGYLSGMDSHASPVIEVDNFGYLHLLLGSHGGLFKHYKSKEKEQLVFPATSLDAGGGTYPSFNITDNNDLYIFSRSGDEERTTWVRCTAASIVAFPSWQEINYFAWFPTSMAPASYNVRTRLYGGGWVDPGTNRCHTIISWDCWDTSITTNTYAMTYMYSDLTNSGYATWKSLAGTILGYASPTATGHDKVCFGSSPKFTYAWGSFLHGRIYAGLGGIAVTDSGTTMIYTGKLSGAATEGAWSYFVMKPAELIFWKADYSNTAFTSINVSQELGGLKGWNRRHGAGMMLDKKNDNYVIDYYLTSKAEDEIQYSGELNLIRSNDLGASWSYKALSKNSTYGVPIVWGPQCPFSTMYGSSVVFSRGFDVCYYNTNMVATTSFIPNGDDIRIVFGTKQIDRVPNTFWNNEISKVRFRVQKEIPSNTDVTSGSLYYVYYGNYFSTSSPPRDPNNVYRFFENWSGYDNYQVPGTVNNKNWQVSDNNIQIFRTFGSYSEQHTAKVYSSDQAVTYMQAANYSYMHCMLPTTDKYVEVEFSHLEAQDYSKGAASGTPD